MLASWLCCRGQEKTCLAKEAQASRRGTDPETAMQETHPRQELRCRKQKTAMYFLKLRLQFFKLRLQLFEKLRLQFFKMRLQFLKLRCSFLTETLN